MSLFKSKAPQKPSLDTFRTKAVEDKAALEKITGGLLSGCHTGGMKKLASLA